MDPEALQVAALGRPFTLGMIYDARKDRTLPGVTLWDQETLEEMTQVEAKPGSDFRVASSDSLEVKSTMLEINGSLKISLLFGLLKGEGSARFLSDVKKSRRQSRVSLQYKATTVFKHLKMSSKPRHCPHIFKSVEASATHVVTGIVYGTNAVFVFDSEMVEVSSVTELEASMKVVVQKIPLFSGTGELELNMTEEEKQVVEKFSCKFYGDFILDSNPATFKDAVKTYVELPKLLGEHGENSVPVTVWMMPLKKMTFRAAEMVTAIRPAGDVLDGVTGLNMRNEASLDGGDLLTTTNSSSAEMVTDVSPGLSRKAGDVLQGFSGLKMRSNDSLEQNRYFSKMDQRFSSFQNLCNIYAASLQDRMAKTLSSIREGKETEKALRKIFSDMEKSPFYLQRLTSWMDDIDGEVSVIRSCMQMMDGAKICPDDTEVALEMLHADVEHVLCFVFTSLETTDPYLQELSDYLKTAASSSSRSTSGSTQEPWFFSPDVTTTVREKAREFGELARALKNSSRFRFLVAARDDRNHRGASVHYYRNAILVSQDFSRPAVTANVEQITHRGDLVWYATDLCLDPETAHPKLLLSEGDKKATQGPSQLLPYSPHRFDHYIQVLCGQALTGRHYWEVEWSVGYPQGVAVGVAYEGLFRKGESDQCRLGYNASSWCYGHDFPTTFAYHNRSLCHDKPFPEDGCLRLGLFLNWPAGSLSFYKVVGENLKHLWTFRAEFSEPVYPAFQTSGDNNFLFLCL